MRVRPCVPAACAAAALLASVAAPASAAAPSAPAAGTATSLVSLLSVSAAGHDLAAGGVRLLTDTVDGRPVARVVVTPLTADGTPHGARTVEAGDSRTVEAVGSRTVVPALAGIAEVTGPALEVGAKVVDGAPTATAGASSLGGLEVLGLPVAVDGVLRAGSAVSGGAAQSTKTLEVTGVALPSIADLLAALGLDLRKLPVDVLAELVSRLDLADAGVAAAQKALDDARALLAAQTGAARAAVDAAVAGAGAARQDLAARTALLDGLTGREMTAAQAQTAATAAVTAADAELDRARAAAAGTQRAADAAQAEVDRLASLPLAGAPLKAAAATVLTTARTADAEADALVDRAQSTATATAAAAAAATTTAELTAVAVQAATDAVALAQAAVDAADRLLAAAQQALSDVVGMLAPQVQALLDALTGVLDGAPLVSLDRVAVSTESVVTSARPGGQRAQVEGGQLQGLRVLGTDLLGGSVLDVTRTTGTTLASVQAAVDRLTGTLSEVLSTVPGLPALKVPAPQVRLLSTDTGTGVAGGFGTATTSVTGLQVTLPAITLPVEVAVPGALSLPGLSVLPRTALPGGVSARAVGDVLRSTSTTIGFGTLTEAARFRPAVAAAAPPATVPTTGGPTATPLTLPRTGASSGLAVLALALVGGAVVLRRREPAEG